MSRYISSLWQRTCSARFLEIGLKGLEVDLEGLKASRDDVTTRMRISEDRLMIPAPEVEEWLRKTLEVEMGVLDLVTEGKLLVGGGQKCLGCLNSCRNSKSSYRRMNRKIEIRRKMVRNLREAAGKFRVVSDPLPPPRVSLLPEDNTVGLEWQLKHVLRLLGEEDSGNVIGICGMGGIGKTALLRKINNKLNQSREFDFVIWATVGQNVDVRRIQDTILRGLNLMDDKYETPDERASTIYRALTRKRCVLLLDDAWWGIDLSILGVPSSSKVVITSRSMDVCRQMNAGTIVSINPLSEEQAWELFRMIVGEATLNYHTNINNIAREIAEECCGLPLALIVVGSVLREKRDIHVWKDVQYQLKSSSKMFSHDSVFSVLRLSFEHLRDDLIKECFLYCSLFLEIEKDQLIDYWIGEGFLSGCVHVEGDVTRNMGYRILQELVSACLLVDVDGTNSIKMHDVIRDMALAIASDGEKYKDKFIVQAGQGLSRVPKVVINWTEAERVSLMDNCIEDLHEAIPASSCPKLSTLILSKNSFAFIRNDFFRSMPRLRVLDLSWSRLEELPSSIFDLISLHYLNLSHTNISQIPESIRRLENLEVFDLSYTTELYLFPSRAISDLKGLQTLNMFHCGDANWTDVGDLLCIGTESFLEELELLSSINDLGLSINGEPALSKLQTSRKLQGCTRKLSIVQCKGVTSLPLSSIQFMTFLDTLEVHNCSDLKEFKIDCLVGEEEEIISERFMMKSKVSFDSLQRVTIGDCWLLEELTWLSFAPNLQSLEIDKCMKLKEILSDQVSGAREVEEAFRASTFPRLKRLHLSYLPSLEIISRITLELPALEEISVVFCPKLKKLPVDKKSGFGTLKMIKGHKNWWDELQWEDDSIVHAFLPYFTEIDL